MTVALIAALAASLPYAAEPPLDIRLACQGTAPVLEYTEIKIPYVDKEGKLLVHTETDSHTVQQARMLIVRLEGQAAVIEYFGGKTKVVPLKTVTPQAISGKTGGLLPTSLTIDRRSGEIVLSSWGSVDFAGSCEPEAAPPPKF
jgi:hypothetical protein